MAARAKFATNKRKKAGYFDRIKDQDERHWERSLRNRLLFFVIVVIFQQIFPELQPGVYLMAKNSKLRHYL